ncbi:MAG: response regulator transcription factor [Chloroflexi bacterium]|nr:response regulator transcription factor [Chloroflexota bacterium]
MEGHILIIDDEASLRQTMARILQRAGYEVTTAADGREGLALISNHSFDLVYSDIRMPDMSGLELLKVIHAKFPDLPVVLFTAQPDLNSAVEAVRNGASDYLLKPLKPQAVIERTHAILMKTRKERRKREIQRQIEALQAELITLEKNEGEEKTEAEPKPVSASSDRFVRLGALTLDLYARRVTMNSRAVNLPPTSFDYLLSLARHSPNLVEYRTLVAEAQGYEADLREAQELTKWHIHHIRQAIEPDPRKPVHVINVRGTGYRLVMS